MIVGDPIELSLTLEDLADDKFVKVVLRADGVVYGSPIPLPNIGLGTYYFKDPSLVFPVNVFEIRAQYIVYEDSAFTILTDYSSAEDIYRLIRTDAESIIEKITELEGIVLSHDLNSSLIGEVDGDDGIIGEIPDMDLVGEISDLDVAGELEENMLVGDIEDDMSVIGSLEMEE